MAERGWDTYARGWRPDLLCQWAYLGHVDYASAVALQRQLLAARAENAIPDTLLVLEHPAVITFGRRAGWDDVLVDQPTLAALGIAVHETNRGGLVTYHGPGQLVGYPICDLRELTGGDVVRYISGLEETMIRVLADYDVAAGQDGQHRGVWVGANKIGAVGVAVSRGITMHGFALNLSPDLAHFGLIRPCGIVDRGVTSLQAERGNTLPARLAAARAATAFGAVFRRQLHEVEPRNLVLGGNGACAG